MYRNHKRLLALALSATMVFSSAAQAASAAAVPAGTSSAIQLGTYLTKEMNYFAKGDSRIPTDGWVRDASTYGGDLALLPFLGLSEDVKAQFGDIGSDVTIALKDADGVYWVAVGGKGVVRVDFSEADTRDIFQYFFGPRYIYNGNSPEKSVVTGLRSDGEHGIWVENSEGAVHIRMVERTLRQKADVDGQINDKLNTFRGTIIDANVKPYDNGNDDSDGAPAVDTALDPNTSEWQSIVEPDGTIRKFQQLSKYGDNNDSYWTSLALLGFGNEYAALRNSDNPADQYEAELARDRVVKGAMNCMALSKLHGTGDGFVMRNYKFTDEPGGGVNGKITYQLFKDSGNDDVQKVEKGDRYIVQKAGNVRPPRSGAEVKYFPTDLYFGDGLPNFAMGADAANAPDSGVKMVANGNPWAPSEPMRDENENFITVSSPGYMLLGDVYNPDMGLGKNDPIVAEARKNVKVYTPYVAADAPVYKDDPVTGEPVLQPVRDYDWAFSYQVQEDVSDKYPELVAKFSEPDPNQPTRAGYDGAEDMTRLTFYTDTSSEEPTGMFTSYFALYNYVIKPELADPNTSAERRAEDELMLELMRDAAATTLNHIIDNGYVLMDPCGHQTTWGKWNRDYFNWDCDSETPGVQNHLFMPDAILNSAEMFMFTRVALELLEDVKDDTTTSTGINMDGLYMTAKDLVTGTDGYATYKSVYDKFAAEYAKMKQPLEPDRDMSELTPITPNDPINGVGYLELMQQFNKRAELMTQYWIDDIQFTLDAIEADENGAIPTEAAMKSYTAYDMYDDGVTPIDPDDKAYLEEALATFQDCLKNHDYANGIGNFGDALMYFCAYTPLSVLCKDEADVWPQIQNAYTQVYEGMLKSQEIPFDIFLMKNIDPDLPGIDEDVESAVRQLIRTPQYLMKYNGEVSYNGVYRKDTLWYEIMDWYDHDTMGSTNVFPFDERRASKFNTCILGVDDKDYEDVQSDFNKGKYTTNYANSIYMYDPTPYTTGYWLGINSGIIAETVPAEAGEITTYTHAQVKTMFSNDGIQGTVKQYVNFLADPSYGTDNDAAVTALNLANTQTFVNKDFTVHPSLFPSLRNVAASCISSDRTQLWLAYEAGGLDCVDAADGSIVAHYSAKDLAQGRALLLVQDEAAGVIYLVTENGVSQINV